MSFDAVGDLDVSPLVPEEYARYRQVIRDGLRFFLEHLPSNQLAEIAAAERRLPVHLPLEERLICALLSCPTLHKLGQVVARDQRLSPTLRKRLETLESMEATTPLAEIERVLVEELGPLADSGIRLESRPLAEGSVAVVVPFDWDCDRDCDRDCHEERATREGVFKVLKPGVEERLSRELEIWKDLGAFLDEKCDHYKIPAIPYEETFETLRRLLRNEIRLRGEQSHLELAALLYRGSRAVKIPELLPFSTGRITAMERIRGRKVTDVDQLDPGERRSLATAVLDAIIATPMWSRRRAAPFHADPHAGNLFLTDDHRLAILDWALVGHLSKEERISLMQVALGALTLNEQRIARAIDAIALAVPDASALRDVVDRSVRRLRVTNLPGLRWLVELLDGVNLEAGVRFSDAMLLFRKTFLTVDGVLADVCDREVVDSALGASALRRLSDEWMGRVVAPLESRDFATHLSNLDLLSAYLSVPLSAARLWINEWRQRES